MGGKNGHRAGSKRHQKEPLNLTNGHGIGKSALCLAGMATLFGGLNIGRDKKAWKYLK